MLKKVFFKLNSIEYSGDSVGEDVRIEIQILDRHLTFKKRIKPKSILDVTEAVADFPTDRKIFEANIDIRIIEEDPLFNDTGKLTRLLKVNTENDGQQQLIYEVTVKEFRGRISKSKASFKVQLTAQVLQAEQYVIENKDGWLKVKIDGITKVQALPAFLKVYVNTTDRTHKYFTVLEGKYKGKSGRVIKNTDGSSRFSVETLRRDYNVLALYSISKKQFTLNGKQYQAIDDPEMPWKNGLYDIEIPDAPHTGGLNYPEAHKATVWFRIGHSGERYLHTGKRTLGCMTIIETKRWPEIYNALIKSRKADPDSVGTLEVVD